MILATDLSCPENRTLFAGNEQDIKFVEDLNLNIHILKSTMQKNAINIAVEQICNKKVLFY